MKKRSEIVKKRSEVGAAPAPKPAVAVAGVVHCAGCDEDIPFDDVVTFVGDDGECPRCGDKIPRAKLEASSAASVAARAAGSPTAPARSGPLNPERKWCGTCGSEWPIVNGGFVINCGHVHAARVDDPRKATSYGPPAGLSVRSAKERDRLNAEDAEREARGAPSPMQAQSRSGQDADVDGDADVDPKKLREQDDARLARSAAVHAERQPEAKKSNADTSGFNASMPTPKITIEGNRLSVEWGKATFPLGMMMNFTVGGFFASVEHAPGDRLKAFREIMSDFEKMADLAFAKQSAWYQEKLGTLK